MIASKTKKPPTTAREELLAGITAELPLMLGVVPFGMIFGFLAIETGFTPLTVMAMSVIIFGGASQIIFIQMAAIPAGPLAIASTVGVLNLRHALYSAILSTYFNKLPLRWRLLLSYLLTDEAFFVSLARFQTEPPSPYMHYHLMGASLILWISWQIATAAGIILGALIPPSLNLGFLIPLTFMAIVLPQIKSFPPLLAFIAAAATAILGKILPLASLGPPWGTTLPSMWIIIATIIGMATGYATDLVMQQKKKEAP